ncbi:polar amino acid transport system permease protein [Rhodoligotrophos appendicifer]|uniref:ABC transporter permease n=1 Tax=Rhodoligotrophos appendicifer TaxID=987056 RepID=UPI001184A706|nr:ABC transporter permease [Rhodoligotrophos appendicifer]
MIDFELMSRYGPVMLQGLWVTVQLVVISVTIGFLFATVLALARLSSNKLIAAPAFAYSYFFRATPILAQIFVIYYGAGQFRPVLQQYGLWFFFRDAFFCAAFAFTLNSAAYQGEILRGAIRAVPLGQIEAAQALGLHRWLIFFKITLPQALITALRPLGNEIILMIKASAVASVITVFDLMGATRLAFARSFDFQVYLWAAVLYLIIVEILRRVWNLLEQRMTRHLSLKTKSTEARGLQNAKMSSGKSVEPA